MRKLCLPNANNPITPWCTLPLGLGQTCLLLSCRPEMTELRHCPQTAVSVSEQRKSFPLFTFPSYRAGPTAVQESLGLWGQEPVFPVTPFPPLPWQLSGGACRRDGQQFSISSPAGCFSRGFWLHLSCAPSADFGLPLPQSRRL